jgi:hypothetical protein
MKKQPITQTIQSRFSCRSFNNIQISEQNLSLLEDYISHNKIGPFGTKSRFEIGYVKSGGVLLKRLNTYGFIKGTDEFLVGAIPNNCNNLELEDFGKVLEHIILKATELGLGTCWMGGTFRKSVFAKLINLQKDEMMPAVIAIGNPANKRGFTDTLIRRIAKSDHRKPWNKLFFDTNFTTPLNKQTDETINTALEMIRLAPSSSNKQPWRIVKLGNVYHFYLCRTPGYKDQFILEKTDKADLQRLDIGIAMSHFESTLTEQNYTGKWVLQNPNIDVPNEGYEYKVSWIFDA